MSNAKDKERILKSAKRKEKCHVQESLERIISGTPGRNLGDQRQGDDIFKMLIEKLSSERVLQKFGSN